MFPPDQSRERRQTVDVRAPVLASALLFTNSHFVDVGVGRAGVAVDALRLTDSAISLGHVVSVGHKVVLEDPDHVTILVPTQGHIAMEIGGGERGVAKGTMAVVRAERRRTRVIAPKDGMSVATTVLVPRYLLETSLGQAAKTAGPGARC